MKSTILRLSFPAAAVAALLLLTPAPQQASAEPRHNQPAAGTFTPVYSPEIPSKIEFCGKTIDLDRTDMYERLDRELTSVAYTHGTTMLIIKRANRFFPVLAPILKANGIPEDILYLACVESSLNPRAYSPAKAAGLWQFIPSTAKQYGLEVNDDVDERYNIEKATAAACRYLKKAYAKYGDWPSVMASYNGGMTRITNELDRQGEDSSLDLYLVEETSRYPYRIMAMKTIMENPTAYGFHLTDKQLYQPRKYRTVKVSGPVESWPDWAKEQGISYLTLREENPWIRSKSLPNKTGKTYEVKIPLKESMSRKQCGTTTYNKNWTK